MIGGAATVAPRPCKVPGCDRPARGRGMCHTHWTKWARANPDVRLTNTVNKAVLDALPGHQAQIVDESGLCEPAVRKALKRLKAEDKIHIGHHEPPTTKGTRWKPVWVLGPGKDARVTAKQKHEQECKSNRQSYARRRAGGSWAGPLGLAA